VLRAWPLAASAAVALALHAAVLGTLPEPPPPAREAPRPTAWLRQIEVQPAPPTEATMPQPAAAAVPVAPAAVPRARPPARTAPAAPQERVAAAAMAPEPAAAVAPAADALLVAAEAADVAAPTYRTRMPPAATLRYRMRRGALGGTASLQWAPTASAYEVRLEARILGALLMAQTSRGGFDAAGLAPERFTDQRWRRSAVAANFQREAGKLTFSNAAAEYPLEPGLQDRLSWMIQLAAIAEADPAQFAPGREILIKVAGGRGELALWRLHVAGREQVRVGEVVVSTLRLSRAARGPHDSGAEVWLDPQRHHLPVRLVLNAPAEGDSRTPLELELDTGSP
jgi:hypothetical protein